MARLSARVVDRDFGFNAIIEETKKFRKSQILIGFQSETVTRSQSKNGRVKEAGESMASIAAQNEYGTKQIPARSFMRTSFDQNITKINRLIHSQYDKVLEGDRKASQALGLIGQFVTGLIQQKIRQITQPPNSARTIAIKKSSKPLIDFGQMVRSVTYKIVKNS